MLPNVTLLQGVSVLDVVTDDSRTRVTGVRIRTAAGEEKVIASDLTVDTSGRMSRAPEWLRQLGYEPPGETVVDARLGYASRLIERRPEHERKWRAVFIQADPPGQPRSGIAFPVEGNRWVVTLCGGGGDYPPTDEAGFLAFARSLPSGEVYDLLRSTTPAVPIVAYRRTENRWRHYDRLSRQPEGFIALGDSVCAFNPVYGQGITTAALQAQALDDCLKNGSPLKPKAVQKKLARIVATPWSLATGEDLHYPDAGGRPSLADRLLQPYVRRVMGVSTWNPEARRTLLEVFTMMAPPQHLLRPSVVLTAMRDAVRGRPAASEQPASSARARQAA
jgi:2-polyprenyl-6-methoxyphenol hydroxylase-like FAD-dependent oxidoreductase